MKDTTTSVQPLIDYFEKMISLNKAEKELIEKKFQSHLYLKRQFALQQGDVCEYFNFVVRGCLRLYKVDASGALHVLEFASENYWIVDLHSFHTKKPAAFNIDALEDTVVLRVSQADLVDIYLTEPIFNRIFRVLVENHFIGQQQRIGQLFSSTAEERYELFMETYPHLINRIPQVQIASYLGITPEFLSRIRSRRARAEKS